MAETVAINGGSYTLADTGDANWGDNMTALIKALCNSTLQLSGGNFVLTADVDFGANFGLKSIYYKSRGTTATTGVVRLANAELIGWRDSGNTANYTLAVNASDSLEYKAASGTARFTIASTGNITLTAALSGMTSVVGTYFATDSSNPASTGVFRLANTNEIDWRNFANNGNLSLAANASNNLIYTGGSFGLGTAGTGIIGTTTNDSAATGNVGQRIVSASGTQVNFPATTVYGDANSIALTAGDWDVSAQVFATLNGATMTGWLMGIATTSGGTFTGGVGGDNYLEGAVPTAVTGASLTISGYRISLTGNTTYYLKVSATFSAGTPQYAYRISARRVR